MRYASDQGPAGVFKTRLVNLSETGAAFLVDRSMAPHIGDAVKVEIPIPGLDQIAWFGTVVRMEAYESGSWWADPDPFADEEKMLVGVQFQRLPSGHRQAIKRGLEDQFLRELRERRRRQQLYLQQWIAENALKFMGYIALTLAAFWFLYFLSMPSANYSADKGSPWGQRFIFFDWQREK
jgi:hypothetical protein